MANGKFVFYLIVIFNGTVYFNAKRLGDVRSGSSNASFGVQITEYGALLFFEKKWMLTSEIIYMIMYDHRRP